MNVGLHYMVNAAGRLTGTVLSGLLYQAFGFEGFLLGATIFVFVAAILSLESPSLFLRVETE